MAIDKRINFKKGSKSSFNKMVEEQELNVVPVQVYINKENSDIYFVYDDEIIDFSNYIQYNNNIK